MHRKGPVSWEGCLQDFIVSPLQRLADKPIWSVVEDALETYIDEYDKLLLEQRRLNDERVLALMESLIVVIGRESDLKPKTTDRSSPDRPVAPGKTFEVTFRREPPDCDQGNSEREP